MVVFVRDGQDCVEERCSYADILILSLTQVACHYSHFTLSCLLQRLKLMLVYDVFRCNNGQRADVEKEVRSNYARSTLGARSKHARSMLEVRSNYARSML